MVDFKQLFAQAPEFMLGVVKESDLPNTGVSEIAFAGRSNVGKSSLINALFNNKSVAKTSNTPGRTRELNFFNLLEKIYMVDLPGYGYAKASKSSVEKWQKLILQYLKGRVELKRVFLLIDSRHGIKDVDIEIMKILDTSAVTYQIILTKIDKINREEQNKILEKTATEIKKHAAAFPVVMSTSSEKRYGLDEVRQEIFSLI
ncbi:MAG: ribosome biogenesis GTP-binding protein YihA/YsxC [Alphaproteobacteria bacterium]